MAGKGLIIPSIFTAVDDLSPKMAAMRGNVVGLANSIERNILRADRVFRKLTPGIGAAQKQLMSMVGAGAMIAGGIQLGSFSFNSMADYEEAVDSFRTIVSDLNDSEFSKFQAEIDAVAKTSRRSAVDVAQSFEKIAGLNASFAQTAEGIGDVSEASITLAKAAKMDLGVAAENLVGIMNQFSFEANQANRTINALAAGQAVGAANISQTAEAFTIFGSIAKGANITLEESVGLIQVLGKFSIFGAEAGTKLRGSILRLQKAGVGYASGQFDVKDALEQVNAVLAKQTTQKKKDAIINKLFGAENVSVGRTLLTNIPLFEQFTDQVTGTSEAQKGAEINSGNLRAALKDLSGEWVNILTGTSGAKEATEDLTHAVQWLTRNLGDIISGTITLVKWWAIGKATLLAAKGAMLAWNVTLGISSALQMASSIAMKGNTVAIAAQALTMDILSFSLKGATVSQLSLNAAMAANPVGMIVLGIAALVAGLGALIYWQHEANKEYEAGVQLRLQKAYEDEMKTIDELTKRLMKLGYSYAEATRKALEFERQTNLEQRAKVKGEIEELRRQKAEKEINFMAMGVMLPSMPLPGHDEIQDKLNAKMRLQTNLAKEGLAITNRAIAFTQRREQPKKVPLVAKENEKFTPEELSSFFGGGSSETTVKNEMTVKIENNSDSPVQVSSGKSRPVDVQPRTTSTKQLRNAYGRNN